ncbi:twin-arginine translocase TatA/TatE family subunit [Amnibacterium flavum]|uniref:Sec-independent protein translocase protein TatA n=1 Tax=Amnibacterium flavum TaxID=2173173 RepID=A0A2V1HQ07_9MICO|nr:twin-arginine translocase TatA/TatE family subunit [Amnibacterium flavum]PVZ94615.1 Sec-independent protein translocase TatA [Amnibacterium flavum]
MLGNLTGWHFLIVLLVILLIFGATKLPALAKGVGQSMKILKNEIKSDDPPAAKSEAAEQPVYTQDPPASTVRSAAEPDYKSEK